MSRVLGVDPGTVRVGLAVSDPDRVVATPAGVVEGGKGAARRIAEVAAERGISTAIVGLPRALSGRETESTAQARSLAAALEREGLDVLLWDERLTTVSADRALGSLGRRGAKAKAVRDQAAATVLLQSWLDARG